MTELCKTLLDHADSQDMAGAPGWASANRAAAILIAELTAENKRLGDLLADLRAIVQRYRDSHDDITRDHAEIDRLTAALAAARDHLLSGDIGGIDAALADIIAALGPD